MEKSSEFLKLVLDSIDENIAVLDSFGKITFVNNSWRVFGESNSCSIIDNWDNVNYLQQCDQAASVGDDLGAKAGEGIRSVLKKRKEKFCLEYPCHSEDQQRWFMMRANYFCLDGESYVVISHQNITERKLAEDRIKELVTLDGLTGISNRREFDEFLSSEMKRCARLKKPICLAVIDVDYFKLLNDTYGHQAGDKCLVQVAELLKQFSKRPSDICARYGGEEFAVVWGCSTLVECKLLADSLLSRVAALKIPNKHSPSGNTMTVSIGLAEMYPNQESTIFELIAKADSLLYKAKKKGRNRIEY